MTLLFQIFQPLLSTYFTRGELQSLRQQIVYLHTLTTDNEEQSKPSLTVNQENITSNSEFSKLPTELLLKIFSYLSPRDLCRCAQVCRQWSEVSWDGLLWQQLHPVRWIFRDDWRMGMDEYEPACTCNEDINEWDRER
jgi:F-box/leucine-rich repeat protein 5